MNTYTIESVNGATCRHRAASIDDAARKHTRLHIRASASTWRIDNAAHGFFQAMESLAPMHGAQPRPIRQPFRVVRS